MTAYEKLQLMNSGKTFLATESMNFYVVTCELIQLIDEMKTLLVDCSIFLGDYHAQNELHVEIEEMLGREFKQGS